MLQPVVARPSDLERRKGSARARQGGPGRRVGAIVRRAHTSHAEIAVIAVDVGTYSFGRYFECRPGQHVLMSGYSVRSDSGFRPRWARGRPRPSARSWPSTGDGGFGQYLGEITTAVKYGMHITHVLLDNAQLGKISKEQRAAEWDVWQTSLHNPEFAAYAQLCGAFGVRVTDRAQLDDALAAGFAHEGPALIEVVTDPDLI